MAVGIELRTPSEEELRATLAAVEAAFGEELRDEDFERERPSLPLDRILGAYDVGRPVAAAASYPFELTIPGGTAPAAGVTWVGALPTHRRRGLLRELMRHQLQDVRERGEPVAILWASEASIYGRFGYGIAAPSAGLDADRARFALRDDPGARGTGRLVARDEARALFRPIYERIRHERPGMLSRTEHWWEAHRLADPEHWRHGAGPKVYALLELDGATAGYAIYRVASKWEGGFARGEVRITEAFAVSPEATRELWRFLFGIDLVVRVRSSVFDPDSPILLMVEDPRALGMTWHDGLWLRLVDVGAALSARCYSEDGEVVFEVADAFCPWNDGRWRLAGGEADRTEANPDLRLRVDALAGVYLGAFSFRQLERAGRVEEVASGALERADRLFYTDRAPWCPEIF